MNKYRIEINTKVFFNKLYIRIKILQIQMLSKTIKSLKINIHL